VRRTFQHREFEFINQIRAADPKPGQGFLLQLLVRTLLHIRQCSRRNLLQQIKS
jgi:hypothetical protein